MRTKMLMPALILLSLLLIASLAACTGAKSSTTPQPPAQTPPTAPGSTPAGPSGGRPGPGQPAPAGTVTPTPAFKVTGNGVISVANYANLYFGSAGQIEKINVETGDSVKKGTVLAALDTISLEAALTQARVNLDQAQLAQAQALVSLDQARLSQIQAQSAFTTAQFNLDKTTAVRDIKDNITDAQWTIKATEVLLKQSMDVKDYSNADALRQNLTVYQTQLKRQQDKLAALLTKNEYLGSNALTYDILGQTYDRLTVEDVQMKELAVQAAQQVIDQTKNGIAFAQKNVDKSNDGITLAQTNINLLQQQLLQATITAPFDGIIATVNQNEKDVVPAPAQSQKPIIYMVDLSTLQLNIAVNELDIPKVKVGQKATVSVDAFPNTKIEGKVSTILPLPTVRGGIVDYTVTVTFAAPTTFNVMIGMQASASIVIE
jgi:multidrug efflux pump subunit AcrA (membrane-fusion protein)